jgi:hypothetical protein
VLVEDFRLNGKGGLLLLTALHVLDRCSSVELRRFTCDRDLPLEEALLRPWGSEHTAQVLAWPQYDLAAIVIDAESRAELRRRVALREIHSYVLNPTSQRPDRGDPLELVAQSGLNVCPPIAAKRLDVFRAEDLWKSLTELSNPGARPSWNQTLGTLGNSTRLVSYTSTARRGTSGGPVIWTLWPESVVAIHVGGDSQIQWGVLIDPSELQSPPLQAELGGTAPRLALGNLPPPQPGETGRAVWNLHQSLHSDSVSMLAETATPVDPFGAVSFSPQVAWSHQWWAPGFAALGSSIGSRVLLGGIVGRYRSPMSGPNFEEPPRSGSARLPFYGALAQLDAELHLARLAPISYTASLGVRAGLSHRQHMLEDADKWVWGPVVSGRANFNWLRDWRASVQLSLQVQEIPVAACAPGCQGAALPRPSIWDVWGSAAVGVEFEP